MTRTRILWITRGVAVGILWLASLAGTVPADAVPNGLFSTGMVLQRGMPVPVWGKAAPGEQVRVTFGAANATATADSDGRWQATLPELTSSSQPQQLVIEGRNRLTFDDVVVGDVWLCSGQSNMAYTMAALELKPDYANDLVTAHFPLVRQGTVAREPALEPAASVPVKWTTCSPATVKAFTAAGFYFARDIHADQNVPVGLILSAWGGTSAESWIAPQALDTVPRFKARAEQQRANLWRLPEEIASFPARVAAWEEANGRAGIAAEPAAAEWAAGRGEGWLPGIINKKWSELGLPDGGVAWIRKVIAVPTAKAGKGFRLDLGQVNEQYVTASWNGKKLGDFGRSPPAFYKAYTHFDVPAADVRAGDNVLVFRFATHLGDRPPLTRSFRDIGLKALAPVDDACDVRVERTYPPLSAQARAARPKTPEGDAAHTSGALYCGMIHPLAPSALKGVLWYQGEGDGSRGYDYRSLLPLLITSWRQTWGREVPFIVQQLPNWKAGNARDTGWAEVREAQAMTATSLPNVGLSVATEIGESDDVHPANKRDIGKRLALVALAQVYGRDVRSSGPVMRDAAVQNDAFRISFKTTGSLRTRDGKPPRLFALAPQGGQFVDAEAMIEGDAVVVRAAGVSAPEALRYAWINDTAGTNLTDDTGLPATPFRTDSRPIRGEP
ncbi:MAG: sialate O-acetylesterase [Planctomycetia bacterium]